MENKIDNKVIRYGHYVNFKNREDIDFCFVSETTGSSVHIVRFFKDEVHNDDQPESLDDITPIELTTEWLERFGFKKWKGTNDWYKKGVILHGRKRGFVVRASMPVVKYVHQLQDVYLVFKNEYLGVKI